MIRMTAMNHMQSKAPEPYVPPTGYESPHDARENGWIGQVPPPAPARAHVCPPANPTPTYAIPQMAPEPWLDPGPLFPNDPTLFG